MRDHRITIVMLAGLGALILHCGCNVTMTMPELRYHTPEVRGGLSGHALLMAQQTTEVVLVPSTLATPPITDAPKFAPDLRDLPGLAVALAASDRLEFSMRAIEDAPVAFDAKYQIAGVSSDSLDERLSCAVLLGGGAGHTTGTDEVSDRTVEREVENYSTELGILAGRRFGMILPYSGVYYARYWADGSVEQDADRYPFDGSGGQVSLNFGLAATVWHLEGRSELAWSFSEWESDDTQSTAFGLALGGSW